LIPQEIERRTIYTILSKPVRRYEFIVGKFLGALLALAINIGVMGIVFVAITVFKAWGAQVPAATVGGTNMGQVGAMKVQLFDANAVWGVVMIYLQFMVLSSVVLMFSVVLTPTVNFFMGLGVYIVGVLGSLTETIMKSDQAGAGIKGLYTVLHYAIPNFDSFNVTNTLLHPEKHIVNMAAYVGKIGLYGVLYSLIMMVIAVIIFQKREV
jgi:ABC-type transport system involved in multi-copper enzyme maturation permease subunit